MRSRHVLMICSFVAALSYLIGRCTGSSKSNAAAYVNNAELVSSNRVLSHSVSHRTGSSPVGATSGAESVVARNQAVVDPRSAANANEPAFAYVAPSPADVQDRFRSLAGPIKAEIDETYEKIFEAMRVDDAASRRYRMQIFQIREAFFFAEQYLAQ